MRRTSVLEDLGRVPILSNLVAPMHPQEIARRVTQLGYQVGKYGLIKEKQEDKEPLADIRFTYWHVIIPRVSPGKEEDERVSKLRQTLFENNIPYMSA